ncbi:MAG: DUF6166 domain-containing protein, partial [Trebonia sp.]
ARRSRGPARYYVGRRPRETEVHVVSASKVEPLEHLRYRSRVPFDWGAATAGALELAYALLVDTAHSQPPDAVCQAFLTDVVAGFEPDGFVLDEGDVALWLLTAFGAGDGPDGSGRRRPGFGRRAVGWLRWRPRRGRAR